MTIELKAEKREQTAKPDKIRSGGNIPAVIYGRKTKPMSVMIEAAEFLKVWKKVGESAVVSLAVGNDSFDCLIKEVQLDPLKDNPIHADFYAFEKGQKVKVKIPIEFAGVSPAVKDMGAVLVKVMHEVEVEAAPKDLPHRLEADISSLAVFGDQIFAKDVKLPAGVTLLAKPEEVIASVYEPKEEKIEEAAPVDLSAIEVEKKGKKDEEGAEAGATPETASKAPAKPEGGKS